MTTEAPEQEVGEEQEEKQRKSTAVGKRDGKRAFDRCRSILSKLDPDVRSRVVDAIYQFGKLCDLDEIESAGAPAPAENGQGGDQLF